MSEREIAQEKIVDFLESHNYFNAPYGVLTGLQKTKTGKIRVITFGVSRYLDAAIYILSPKKISVRGQGGLAYKFEGDYDSPESLIEKFKSEIRA
jgi:hypothetical protein